MRSLILSKNRAQLADDSGVPAQAAGHHLVNPATTLFQVLTSCISYVYCRRTNKLLRTKGSRASRGAAAP